MLIIYGRSTITYFWASFEIGSARNLKYRISICDMIMGNESPKRILKEAEKKAEIRTWQAIRLKNSKDWVRNTFFDL